MEENSESESEVIEVKENHDENIVNQSVIKEIKESKVLTIDEMEKIIERCNEKKKENPQVNIIDKNFLRLVWSIYRMESLSEESFVHNKFNGSSKLSDISQNFAYEFLLCCHKLSLGFCGGSSYFCELCTKHDYSLIEMVFLQNKKPINVKFLYWLEENGYFSKLYSGIKLKNFIEQRKDQVIGDYEFDSYDEFNKFINNDKYKGAKVYVTELLKVLSF